MADDSFALLRSAAVCLSGGLPLHSTGRARAIGLVVLLLLGGVGLGYGQSATEPAPFCRDEPRRAATLDTRGLGAVYCATDPVVTRPLVAAHGTARPVFYGAIPLAWGGAILFRDESDYADAYRLTLVQGTTYGLVLGLKRAVGRPRPYVTRSLTSRSSHYGESEQADAYTSFPSGHAALSAALVMSWSLSHPRWYVVGPGSVWATAVALSRLHLGVHYPSDVVMGLALGAGVALLTHQLRGQLTPSIVQRDAPTGVRAASPVRIRIQF